MQLLTVDQIQHRIQDAFPDARIRVIDLTGTRDHWQAEIVSAAFEGKLPIARHRMIYDLFTEELKGPLHALTLKTLTPQQAQQQGLGG